MAEPMKGRALAARLLGACLLLGGHAAAQPAPPAAAPGAPAVLAPGRGSALAPPTELLFDAIAIGSMDIVRDAIARGANLNARNVLGQRPVDLAIDVGRSDMAFLLLSMMRAGQAPTAAALPREAPARPEPRASGRGSAPVAAPATLPRVRLWANDGGAAMPELGFMGFDASRPDGAREPTRAAPAAPPPSRAVRRDDLSG